MEPFQLFCADLKAAWELYKLRKVIQQRPVKPIKVKTDYVSQSQLDALRVEAGASGIMLTILPGMGNGQRATGNGQRATGNGQRATGNGQRATGNGQRATGNGQPEKE